MAAVVCHSMAKMASILCNYVANLCSIVAHGVRQSFAILFESLSENCVSLSALCTQLLNLSKAMCVSPFFPYLAVTYILNLPPCFFGFKSVFGGCGSRWLMLNTFLTAMHVLCGTYMVIRIRIKDPNNLSKQSSSALCKTVCLDPDLDDFEVVDESMYVQAEGNGGVVDKVPGMHENVGEVNGNVGEPDSWDRIRYVLCYDMVMAVYYALFILWIIWQSLGTKIIVRSENEDQDCGRYLVQSVAYGFLYMGLVLVALICSICHLRFKALSQKIDEQQSVSTQGNPKPGIGNNNLGNNTNAVIPNVGQNANVTMVSNTANV